MAVKPQAIPCVVILGSDQDQVRKAYGEAEVSIWLNPAQDDWFGVIIKDPIPNAHIFAAAVRSDLGIYAEATKSEGEAEVLMTKRIGW